MFTVIYEDRSLHYITGMSEYSSEHINRNQFKTIATLTVFDIENESDCHSSRAYIFFNESLEDVKKVTNLDSTKMLIMCNALITSMAHTDENDNYVVNTWLTRDRDVMSHLLRSQELLFF